MAKVSLVLGEDRIKANLTLEVKGGDQTWDTVGGTWDDHTASTWDGQRGLSTLESKIKVNLALESK